MSSSWMGRGYAERLGVFLAQREVDRTQACSAGVVLGPEAPEQQGEQVGAATEHREVHGGLARLMTHNYGVYREHELRRSFEQGGDFDTVTCLDCPQEFFGPREALRWPA